MSKPRKNDRRAARGTKRAAKQDIDPDATPSPRMKRKRYESELARLQIELVKLQDWVKRSGARIVVVFEGRDAAGKGGVIKRITERLSPRVFRVVALPTPSERERTQLYFQRYIAQMPAAGEVVLFDRSWYNRAGVERVMNFCTDEEYRAFIDNCPGFERWLIQSGIHLVKYWLSVSNSEQKRRFRARIDDPVRRWKLSPMDLEARRLWYDYSRARDAMFAATDSDESPWNLIRSDDKRRARLNCIAHLLSTLPYDDPPAQRPDLPRRAREQVYDDEASLAGRRFVEERF